MRPHAYFSNHNVVFWQISLYSLINGARLLCRIITCLSWESNAAFECPLCAQCCLCVSTFWFCHVAHKTRLPVSLVILRYKGDGLMNGIGDDAADSKRIIARRFNRMFAVNTKLHARVKNVIVHDCNGLLTV
jgi:hypothetical protein